MTNERDEPDFGPGGYLPRRAAQRARKIVLREQMSLGWPLAAVAAGVLLVAVGVAFTLARSSPPGPPFTALGALDAVEPGTVALLDSAEAPTSVLVVRAGGGVRVFAAPQETVVYCEDSRRLEAPGVVWDLRGRLVGGNGSSLQPLAFQVHDGDLYVDPTSNPAAPPPAPRGETPSCVS